MVATTSSCGKFVILQLNLTLNVKVDCCTKTIGSLTKVFGTFGPKFGDPNLSYRADKQVIGTQTDAHTLK